MKKDLINLDTARCDSKKCCKKENCKRFNQMEIDRQIKPSKKLKRSIWVSDFFTEFCKHHIKVK